jgi:hypothetical protein
MTTSIHSKIAMSLVAIGALGAAATASAAPAVYAVSGSPAPVYVQWHRDDPYVRRDEDRRDYYAQEDHERWERHHDRDWRESCRAPRWDPYVRYMPGQAVWRNGKLYVATDVSSRVYNENSPPELTPNYWAHATCR